MAHRCFTSLSVAAALLSSALVAWAHHGSSVSYYLDKTITLTGVATEWEFANPHPQIYFDVKDEQGQAIHWATELLPTPRMLKNLNPGWSRTTIRPGDQIVLKCNPSRADGAKVCLARELQLNGKDWPLGAGPPAAGAPKGKE